jgi:hypothetical protein
MFSQCPSTWTAMTRPDSPREEVADAHIRDVEVKEKHGVRYHAYWFDPTKLCGVLPRRGA